MFFFNVFSLNHLFFFSLLIKHRMQQTRSEAITLTESEERDSTIIKPLLIFFSFSLRPKIGHPGLKIMENKI